MPIKIINPDMHILSNDGQDLGLDGSRSPEEAMEKVSFLPDGEYILKRPDGRIIKNPAADDSNPEPIEG